MTFKDIDINRAITQRIYIIILYQYTNLCQFYTNSTSDYEHNVVVINIPVSHTFKESNARLMEPLISI
jgi:hypothetical protein